MSYARKLRRARRQEERDAITLATRLRGCRCDFEIEHRHTDGIRRAVIRHDDWCPAIDSGSQLIVGKGRHQSPEDFARVAVELIRELSR